MEPAAKLAGKLQKTRPLTTAEMDCQRQMGPAKTLTPSTVKNQFLQAAMNLVHFSCLTVCVSIIIIFFTYVHPKAYVIQYRAN